MQAGKLPGDVLELVRDVSMQWTLAFEMIQRLLLLKDAVHTVLSNSDKRAIRDLDISAENLFQLRELASTLEPLCLAMQGMCGQEYSSVSIVAPLLHKLLTKELATSENDTPVIFDFKTAATDDLAARYNAPGLKQFIVACTYLDPQFKELRYIKDLQVRSEQRRVAVE